MRVSLRWLGTCAIVVAAGCAKTGVNNVLHDLGLHRDFSTAPEDFGETTFDFSTPGNVDLGSTPFDFGGGSIDLRRTLGDAASSGGSCDPVAQTGCSSSMSKCTFVDDGTGTGGLLTACVTPTGTLADGMACTRGSGASGLGMDDCAGGEWCGRFGSETPTGAPVSTHCRTICATDSDCNSSQSELCAGLVPDPTMMMWMWGLCVPACQPFGTECTTIAGSGYNCSFVFGDTDGQNAFFSCKQPGSGAIGSSCAGSSGAPDDSACGADMICLAPSTGAAPVCTLLCDGTTTHGCPSGKTCMGAMPAMNGMPAVIGVCQ